MTPFRPGELTDDQVAKLRDIDRRLGLLERLSAQPPLTVSRSGGVPVVGTSDRPEVLARVRFATGSPPVHTVVRKTRDASNNVIDYEPVTQIEQVLNPLGTRLPDGSLVMVFAIPDQAGWWWALPVEDADRTAAAAFTGYSEADCFRVTVGTARGACNCVDADQELILVHDGISTPPDLVWVSTTALSYCDGVQKIKLSRDGTDWILALLDDSYTFDPLGPGPGGLTFSGYSETLCTDPRESGPCSFNAFTLVVSCGPCEPDEGDVEIACCDFPVPRRLCLTLDNFTATGCEFADGAVMADGLEELLTYDPDHALAVPGQSWVWEGEHFRLRIQKRAPESPADPPTCTWELTGDTFPISSGLYGQMVGTYNVGGLADTLIVDCDTEDAFEVTGTVYVGAGDGSTCANFSADVSLVAYDTGCGGVTIPACCGYGDSNAPDLTVSITEGPNAGGSPYTATWNATDDVWEFVAADLVSYVIKCDGDSWTLYPSGDTASAVAATSAGCYPLALTFPGAVVGSDEPVTVEDPEACCDTVLAGNPDLCVTVPDGAAAGSYTATWDGVSKWIFQPPSLPFYQVSCVAGQWIFGVLGSTADEPIVAVCDTFYLAFPGSRIGAAGAVTVAICPPPCTTCDIACTDGDVAPGTTFTGLSEAGDLYAEAVWNFSVLANGGSQIVFYFGSDTVVFDYQVDLGIFRLFGTGGAGMTTGGSGWTVPGDVTVRLSKVGTAYTATATGGASVSLGQTFAYATVTDVQFGGFESGDAGTIMDPCVQSQ